MEERPTESYGNMLEKYREVDEDEILSNLTKEELQQLEGEIDREVLNQIPEDTIDDDYSQSDNQYSSTSEEEDFEAGHRRPRLSVIQTKHLNRSLEKQRSLEAIEPRRKSSKPINHFKVPPFRKAKSKEELKRQKSEEGGEMKKELLQAVKRRAKRRTSRANSSGLARRYNRRNSSCLLRSRRAKVAKEDKRNTNVNENFITEEMLSLRPKLKKVKTREPAQVNDMLHGVSLTHITSGAKTKEEKGDYSPSEDSETEKVNKTSTNEEIYRSASLVEEELSSFDDDEVASANDKILRRLNARALSADAKNDDATSHITAGSTSAESYDVIGELSINPNSVEEMLLRIWNDDPQLIEVNLNNIQNVGMEVFEELASAMECNTHVKQLHLANVGLTDKPAKLLAITLKKNKTLEKLNVESNFITGDSALRLVAALRKNQTLTELRIDNQRHIFGAKVEHEFSKILKDNKTLLRFGYQFHNPGPRMAASNSLTRNMDDVRKKRVIEQRRRAQINRPTIRRQPSNEWHHPERGERRILGRGIPFDLQSAVQDEEVKRLLGLMDPSQYAVLEQWFINNLLAQENNSVPHVSQASQSFSKPLQNPNQQPAVHLKRNESPRRAVSPREHLMESIRNPGRLTPTPKDSKRSPSPLDSGRAQQRSTNVKSPTDKAVGENKNVIRSNAQKSDLREAVIPWDGDDYDSDEYEVIEVEVSESDESMGCSDVSKQKPELQNISSPNRLKMNFSTLRVPVANSDDEEELSLCNSQNPLKRPNSDPAQKLKHLQLEDPRFVLARSPPTNKLNLASSSLPSTPDLSPATARKVMDDESWITRRPHHRLGTK